MSVKLVQFLAVVLTALALIPSGAHLAALPNKIDLPEAQYFTVQGIYYGWAVLGLLWPLALTANGVLAYLVRAQQGPLWLAVLASLCFVLMLGVFLLWTLPANQATENWTAVPENWEALRRQWEYSHAANSVLVLVAVCAATLSTLLWRPPGA